ncbi:unnamed protein product [Cyclocybe aegerita]|uniref:DUF6699 domain-containing protein n=1 Tax=Cyclocybe aegerita TaxID=1973307 RepID=A0A8S0VQV5_CYCAE|nr:unnamed protein product [Cyclocybe aegerita]
MSKSKRVQFAATNIVYSDGSESSSPALSVSSLPSSSSPDLRTPPNEEDEDYQPAVYPRTPYTTHQDLFPDLAIPVPVSKPIQIHFLLAFSPFSEPAVNYDLSLPPTIVDGQYPPSAFAESATSPPLPSLLITHPLLKYCLEVVPAASVAGSYVSVMDVLNSLYKELRLPIHPVEYAELTDVEVRHAVDAAYYSRCGRIRDVEARIKEERKGIKKVDLLMGRTRFMGLSGTMNGPETWELNVL